MPPNNTFTFLGFKMTGKPQMVGDQAACYDINLRSFKRFLSNKGNEIKIVPLDYQEEIKSPFANGVVPPILLLRKLIPMRKIERLVFYPESGEIIFAFRRDLKDALKIVKR